MKFLVEIPDRVMDRLLRRASTTYSRGLDATYADVVQFLIMEHPASVEESVMYIDVYVEQIL